MLVFSALFIVLFFNPEGSAQVYKYVDKDGVVHFTDNPTDSKYQEAKQFGWDDPREATEKTPAIKTKKWPQPEDFEIRKFSKPKRKNQ
jgi:hypothetical protein